MTSEERVGGKMDLVAMVQQGNDSRIINIHYDRTCLTESIHVHIASSMHLQCACDFA